MRRVLELDGLRGLAALAVLVAHLFGEPEHGFRALSVGWLGVSVFFALSGYLIGGIILDDIDKPNFFRGFFARRAARILPIYIVVVTLSLIAAGLTSGSNWADRPLHPAAYFTFSSNILISFGQDGGHWLLPTWTVAVEEQFYLLLPLLILIIPRKRLAPVLAALCLSSIIYRVLVVPSNIEAANMLLPGRADTLLYGVTAAFLQRSASMARHLNAIRSVALVALAALVATLASGSYSLTVVLSPALVGIATSSLILLATAGTSDLRSMRAPALTWFGAISYGLYLVHQPINGLAHGLLLHGKPDVQTAAQIAVTVGVAAASVAVAWASWRWFEAPIRSWARAMQTRSTDRALQEGQQAT